jgi:hypothetical protein
MKIVCRTDNTSSQIGTGRFMRLASGSRGRFENSGNQTYDN